jgi:hypothetical protein
LTEPPGRVRPGRPAPTGGPRPDRWRQADRWGWGGFESVLKQKKCQENKGFLKNLLTSNKEQKNNLNLAKIILINF